MRFLSALVFSLFLLSPAHAQWVRIDSPGLPQNGIFAVSAVVASDEAVHALTNLGSNRVYRSTDDGSTWTLVPSVDVASGLYGAEATVVALQPGTALHVSVDGGLNWTRRAAAAAPLDTYFAGLARVDAGGRAHAFLSNTNPNRLYVTRDDFATVEPKLASEQIGRVVSNGRVLVATNGSTPSAGYFRSTDGGQNWAAAAAPGLGSQYLYASRDSFFVSGVAPSSGERVIVASADGTSWTQVATGAVLGVAPALASSARHSAVFALAQAPSSQSRLYASVRSGRQPVNVTDNYVGSPGTELEFAL